jgi:hypothetical protein
MAIRKSGHCLVQNLQERFGCCPHGLAVASSDDSRQLVPNAPCCREVEVDAAPHGHPCLRRLTALHADRVNLCSLRCPAERRRVDQHRQVTGQELCRHVAGVLPGSFGDTEQPRLVNG